MTTDRQIATPSLADRLGVWVSGLCVVHCLLTPVLLSASVTLAHLLPGEESTHRALAAIVATLGAIALIRGFRIHGKRRVLAWMVMGLACIFFAAWFGDRLPSRAWEIGLTMTGSTFMILAHRRNHTFCSNCTSCTHA